MVGSLRARWLFSLLGVLVVPAMLLPAFFAGCGGSDICLGCNPNGSPTPISGITVVGTVVFSDLGNVSGITVTICSNEEPRNDPSECTNPRHATTDLSGDFERDGVPAGSQQIFFDTVPPGQEGVAAKLQDPQGELGSVDDGFTATLANVEINFARNVATADISVTVTPTSTPTPPATATPTATPTPTP
ncbi:MAG TPA: hypothetical protein VFD92_18880 [Candidatus Binatia bacterium]|nr:hypothetical protein [Candidatus Binatia bacterium]